MQSSFEAAVGEARALGVAAGAMPRSREERRRSQPPLMLDLARGGGRHRPPRRPRRFQVEVERVPARAACRPKSRTSTPTQTAAASPPPPPPPRAALLSPRRALAAPSSRTPSLPSSATSCKLRSPVSRPRRTPGARRRRLGWGAAVAAARAPRGAVRLVKRGPVAQPQGGVVVQTGVHADEARTRRTLRRAMAISLPTAPHIVGGERPPAAHIDNTVVNLQYR